MTKPAATPQTEGIIASAIEIAADGGTVERRVKLLPYGTFHGRDGRGPYVLDGRDHAEQVIAATRQFLGTADLLFNYDHQSEFAAVNGVGGQAKAAGWIKAGTLAADDDGIYAEVDWTPAAEAALAAREYRYHSPHFRVAKGDRRVTRLVNAGLTNSPNLDLPALASQEPGVSAEGVLMTQIALAPLVSALALSAGAGEAEVVAAIGSLKASAAAGDQVLASSRTTLGLAADADSEAVLAAVAEAKKGGEPDPAKFVPKTGFDELKARLDRIEDDRVLAMVDAACSQGKLPPTPEMRKWALDLGKKDEPALQAYLDGAVPFQGGTAAVKGDPKPEKGKLSEDEVAICAKLGLSHEAYLKSRDEEEVI